MHFKHTFKNYAILSGLIAISLLGVYGVLVLTNNVSNPQPKPLTVSSAVNCSFPDKSFCSTDQLMRGYVSSKDFSDILENQIPVTVSCAGKMQAQQYCGGKQSELVVQLFKVQKNETAILYTRNEYIDFFLTFFKTEGTFAFNTETESGSMVVMSYTAAGHGAKYSLFFTKQNSAWKLSYVAVNTA